MSNAKKCDACHEYYDSVDVQDEFYKTMLHSGVGGEFLVCFSIKPVRGRGVYSTEYVGIDLCAECFSEGMKYIVGTFAPFKK